MIKYYKIVSKNLTSYVSTNKAEVQYKIDEYVHAPNWLPKEHQVLFVFSSLHHACTFISNSPTFSKGSKIYECEVKRAHKHLPPFLSRMSLSYGRISFSHESFFPQGTIAVKEVKLVKEFKGI